MEAISSPLGAVHFWDSFSSCPPTSLKSRLWDTRHRPFSNLFCLNLNWFLLSATKDTSWYWLLHFRTICRQIILIPQKYTDSWSSFPLIVILHFSFWKSLGHIIEKFSPFLLIHSHSSLSQLSLIYFPWFIHFTASQISFAARWATYGSLILPIALSGCSALASLIITMIALYFYKAFCLFQLFSVLFS